jgi:hypothetical protein
MVSTDKGVLQAIWASWNNGKRMALFSGYNNVANNVDN